MSWLTAAALAGLVAGGTGFEGAVTAAPDTATTLSAPATYWVYVGSESEDFLHRVRFDSDGAGRGSLEVEVDLPVGALYRQSGVPELYTESEAPHGVAVDTDAGVVYMTTGHGLPDGKLWKVEAGTGRLLADPVDLGRFPASLGVSPDGGYVYVANFNLHGRMEPSSISVVHAGQMMEVARIQTCTMPHGSRVHPQGRHHYSVCMMDDQLVEIDGLELDVSRRLFLGMGEERALDPGDRGFHDPDAAHGRHGEHGATGHGHYEASCSPTWVQPSHDGERIYVACNRSDQILEVDFEGWEVLRRFDTGRGPYNVDVTADNRLLVVTLKQGHGVEFIDLAAGETAARVDTSTRVVHGVALSPDSRYAFISVEGVGAEPGKVDVFDLTDFQMVGSVEVGLQASGIAFWKLEGG